MKNKYVRPLTEALEVCALEFLAASPSQLRVNHRRENPGRLCEIGQCMG